MGKKKREDAQVVDELEEKQQQVPKELVEQDSPKLKEVKTVNVRFKIQTYFKTKYEARRVYKITEKDYKELLDTKVRFEVV